jgi:hypothetical protein
MQPLIDADVLRYEVGFAAETGWQGEGIPPFDYAAELLDNRIANICAMVGATSPPILYLTGKTNFRNDIAKRKKYKERPSHKPFHFANVTAYIKGKYDWVLEEGLEADDLMAMEQTARPNDTIICTRDKDLRQVEGWHYGWEIGKQAQFGPYKVEGYGEIFLETKVDAKGNKSSKLTGYGNKFFLAQCLMGDVVDSVPGLEGCGPKGAYTALQSTLTYREGYEAVLEAYFLHYGFAGWGELLEQGRLLWMTRYRDEWGNPILWELPE